MGFFHSSHTRAPCDPRRGCSFVASMRAAARHDAVRSTLLRARGRSGVNITTPQVRLSAALASLRRIQHHGVCIDNGEPVSGITTINHDQAATMAAMKVPSSAPATPLSAS